MSTKMDFENKYKAWEAQPFDQKNEMYKPKSGLCGAEGSWRSVVR
jgi:hypothetical protein